MRKNQIIATAAVVAGIGFLAYNKATTVNFGDIVIDGIPEKSDEAVRVMSYNLRYCNDKDGSVKNRSKITSAIISQYAPDSFGVQEATGRWLDILEKSLGDKYAYVAQTRDTQGYKSERNAVFYLKDKYNLVDSGTIWLSETPKVPFSKSFNTNCTRIATWAVLENKETGLRYTHLNTHLDHILEETRVCQVKVLLDKLRELQKDGKVVCTGDFNTNPESEVYAVMTQVTDDTRVTASNTDSGNTFHDYGRITDKNESIIDYIFASKDTTVNTFRIIRNTAKGMYSSDHYPIVADIII